MSEESSYPHSEPDLRSHPVAVDTGHKTSWLRRGVVLFGVFIIFVLVAVIITFFIPIEKRVGWVQSYDEDSLAHAIVERVFFHNRIREPMNYVFASKSETFETSFSPKKIAWVNVQLRLAEPLKEPETFRLRLYDSATMMIKNEEVYELEAGESERHLFTDYLPEKTLRIEVEHLSREDRSERLAAQIYITADH